MRMYREEDEKQMELKDFYLPFGGSLNEENRWVILSKIVPWGELEKKYLEKLSDREVVEQIKENPYLQYFVGLEGYKDEAPFDASMPGRNPADCCSAMQPGFSLPSASEPSQSRLDRVARGSPPARVRLRRAQTTVPGARPEIPCLVRSHSRELSMTAVIQRSLLTPNNRLMRQAHRKNQ
jgi:hypothetical protein